MRRICGDRPDSSSRARRLRRIVTDVAKMRQLFGTMTPTSSLSTVRSAFSGVCGNSLDEAEAKWMRFLDGQ